MLIKWKFIYQNGFHVLQISQLECLRVIQPLARTPFRSIMKFPFLCMQGKGRCMWIVLRCRPTKRGVRLVSGELARARCRPRARALGTCRPSARVETIDIELQRRPTAVNAAGERTPASPLALVLSLPQLSDDDQALDHPIS